MKQMSTDVIAAAVAATLVYIFPGGPTHSLAAAQVSTPQKDSVVGSKEKPLVFDAASIKPNDSGLGGKGGRGGRGGAVQITTGRGFRKKRHRPSNHSRSISCKGLSTLWRPELA